MLTVILTLISMIYLNFLFLVGVLISMEAVIAPGLRSYVAQLVKKEDLGWNYIIIILN